MEPGAHPTRQPGHRPDHHKPEQPKRPAKETDGPSRKIEVSPKEFLTIAGDRLPTAYRRALRRYRYGPGAAKADFLVSEPIPWTNPLLRQAGTVHLGGTHADIVRQENATAAGQQIPDPFTLVVDPAVTDPTRASGRKHPV